jgi:hypothetical protein
MAANEVEIRTAYQVLGTDGMVINGQVFWPLWPLYQDIAALVRSHIGGEPMEHVSVLQGTDKRDMFIAEMGHMRLTTRAPMPFNSKATTLYRNALLQGGMRGHDPDTLPTIVGNAVLFARIVWT